MNAEAHPRIRAGVFLIALLGVGLRLALALAEAPGGGDPSYSYAYRAVLLLDGQWDALWLMWHPPGMSIAMALVSLASVGLLAPWWAGVVVTLACTAGLIVLLDNLLRHRLAVPELRLAAAILIATQESLVHWARMPLTEPVFLFLLLLAVRTVDREDPRTPALVRAGFFIGLTALFRFEGVLALAGLAAGVWWTTRRLTAAMMVTAGGALAVSWMAVNPAYVAACVAAQGTAYTIPPVSIDDGVAAVAARVPAVLYYALTTWLPNVLLLPYWVLAAVGLRASRDAAGRRINRLLIAVLAPVVIAVMWSVMHKRTGAFLVPPVIAWAVMGLDWLWLRAARFERRRLAAVGFVLALCAIDLARLAYAMRAWGGALGVVQAQVDILNAPGVVPGRVFAFAGEPSLYGLLEWPERYEHWRRADAYGAWYRPGAPRAFVDTLRASGVRYLTFHLPAERFTPSQQWAGPPVVAEDLRALSEDPGAFGLALVDRRESAGGDVRVYEVISR